jgi:hypothetical protein
MKKYFSALFYSLTIVLFFITVSPILAQSESSGLTWPQGLGFANRLEYSYNVEDETEILENWLNLDYSFGMFSAGLRFEVFQPNDPDPSISRGKENYAGIDYKYFKADIGERNEGLEIIGGNYYTLFSREWCLKVMKTVQ